MAVTGEPVAGVAAQFSDVPFLVVSAVMGKMSCATAKKHG